MKTIKALLALMMLLIPVCAAAQEARELTADCVITSGHVRTTSAHDNDYTTAWRSERVRRPYLEFQLPEGETAGWLYVCFADMPQSWAVEEKIDGKWQVVADGSTDYIHALVELNGQNRFRIVENSGITTRLKLNEVFVFGAGDLPDWVQRWEPTVEKADLLVLATHPDDELIFFGGTIPTYAVEQKKNVVVAYMSYATAARRSELLNGLWHMGVRNYPVIGTFGDSYSTHMDDMYARWGKEKVRRYVMGLIRQAGRHGHPRQGRRIWPRRAQGYIRRERLLRGECGGRLRSARAGRSIRHVDGQKALSAHGR
ncbi:MAG: PIG-L family deacetylase [Christensenellales bacterium]